MEDPKISAYHISLYLALFQLWNYNRFCEWFQVNRMELMNMSRIRSPNTYAKCIKQLDNWGYIHYRPSANIHSGSKVSCIRFDTGTITENDTRNDTGNSTGDDTLFKSINYTKDKQGNPNTSENERRKKTKGQNRLNTTTDKDYSEPL